MHGVVYQPRIQTAKGRTACAGGCGPTKCGGPRTHHSAEEARYCDVLGLQKKAGVIKNYRTQVRYDIHDRMGRPCGYLSVDFEVEDSDGKIRIDEYKGTGFLNSPEFKHKRALFTWCYPHIEYRTITRKDLL